MSPTWHCWRPNPCGHRHRLKTAPRKLENPAKVAAGTHPLQFRSRSTWDMPAAHSNSVSAAVVSIYREEATRHRDFSKGSSALTTALLDSVEEANRTHLKTAFPHAEVLHAWRGNARPMYRSTSMPAPWRGSKPIQVFKSNCAGSTYGRVQKTLRCRRVEQWSWRHPAWSPTMTPAWGLPPILMDPISGEILRTFKA